MRRFPLEIIETIEQCIVAGRISEATRLLKTVKLSYVPRGQAVRVASLARRASVPEISVRVLEPIVHSSNPSKEPPTDVEKAEYAASLVRIGAPEEARGILKSLSSSGLPEVHFYSALAELAQWNYSEAVGFLKTYLEVENPLSYFSLVAKVNLGACYVFLDEHEKALEILEPALIESRARALPLLEGNILQFLAQSAIATKAWHHARQLLDDARKTLNDPKSVDALFIRKWNAIAEFLQDPFSRENLSMLRLIRSEAVQRKHWETIRHCDFYEAVGRKDKDLYLRVYMGTPYTSFRKKLEKAFGEAVSLPEVFYWKMGKVHRGPVLDFLQGKVRGKNSLKNGQVVHRLLSTMVSDHYKAFRIATLYGAIFPREHYNPRTSPLRVHQAIQRLKVWIRKSRLPLKVVEHQREYRLIPSKPCTLLIPSFSRANRDEQLLVRMRSELSAEFTSADIADLFSMSTRNALNLVHRLQAKGFIRKQRKHLRVTYSVVSLPETLKKAA